MVSQKSSFENEGVMDLLTQRGRISSIYMSPAQTFSSAWVSFFHEKLHKEFYLITKNYEKLFFIIIYTIFHKNY